MRKSDLISRAALKCELDLGPDEWAKGRTIEAIIDDLPTIDAEPVRHGRWEKASEYMPIYVCSECKERNLFKNGNNVFSNYCPNCGAKMRGDEDTDE